VTSRRRPFIIAIDGPSGVGKGTVARAIARELGSRHVDTGAMYRAVGWQALQRGVPLDDEPRVAEIARAARFDLEGGRVRIDGHDVTLAIRTPDMDRAATAVARLPAVRAVLVECQRAMADTGTVVMEGRDIGTVVFPDADVKIYLDASPEERARRRASDPAHAGRAGGIASVAQELQARDQNDRTRLTSPLTKAADAILVDTTGLPLDEVVRRVWEIVTKKGGIP
jgi:cytidylate kinase